MKKVKKLDKSKMLSGLGKVSYEADKEQDEQVIGGLSIARSIPRLAGINNESEYMLIKKAAEKLLDVVPSANENE